MFHLESTAGQHVFLVTAAEQIHLNEKNCLSLPNMLFMMDHDQHKVLVGLECLKGLKGTGPSVIYQG